MPENQPNTDSRYVDGGAATTTIVQRNAVRVHWIHLFPETVATVGVIKIYDGLDTGGRLKWQMETGVVGAFAFSPPIPCRQGLYIGADANIGGYTVGYEVPRAES